MAMASSSRRTDVMGGAYGFSPSPSAPAGDETPSSGAVAPVSPIFRSDRMWEFDVPVDVLWDRINAVGEYRSWWPWLRELDASDAIAEGGSWACVVSPPLPYSVRFDVHFDRVETYRSVDSTVRGDIEGSARLTLNEGRSDGRSGASARLVSQLRPANPLLRGFGLVARPLVEHGHDWILDQGRRQFVERAFA